MIALKHHLLLSDKARDDLDDNKSLLGSQSHHWNVGHRLLAARLKESSQSVNGSLSSVLAVPDAYDI